MALATILLSSQGITGWVDPTKITTGDLMEAKNVDFSYGHMVQKEGGTLKVNAVALSGSPTVLAGFDYWPTSTIQRRVIATGDGKLYKDDMTGTFGTTLKSGLGGADPATKKYHLVEGGAETQGRNKKLFIANGFDPVQILSGDGATTSDIGANKPSDWTGNNQPSFLFRFRTTMAGGGNLNDPHRVYISSSGDHEDFSGGAGGTSLSVFPGEGQKLVAGLSGLGRAYLWKYPSGIYYVQDDTNVSGDWFIRRITGQYGAADTPHSVVQIDQSTIAFLSSAGDVILMQESAGSLTGVEFVNLTKQLNLRTFIKNTFDLSRLKNSQIRWYADKLQLHVIMSALGSGLENRRLIIDFNTDKPKVHMSDKDLNSSLWMELDSDRIERPIIGDNAGFVRKIDQTSRSKEGSTPYTMLIATVPTDFSDIDPGFSVKKLFYRLHMEYEVTGNYDVSVEIVVDGVSKGTVTFNQGQAGSILPFELPGFLSGTETRRRSRAIAGEGYYLGLRIIESSTNNPRIARAWIEFDPLEMSR